VAARRIPLVAVVGATVLALVAAVGAAALWSDDEEPAAGDDAASSDYDLAPTGTLPDELGGVVLASLEGSPDRSLGELIGTKPVVVNFFASWCRPCIDEMPAFERVHQDVGDQVTFVGMANQDRPADALATVARTGVTYPTYDDPGAAAITYFGAIQMPTTVFIDAEGTVVDMQNGALNEEELRAKLGDLFGVAS
jgi:thiol-disulfide isomerase/thioredoxin